MIRAILTTGVTVGLLYLVLRAIQPAELRETLAEISVPLVLLAALAAAAFVVTRAIRYALLLGTHQGQFTNLLAITLSGWGASLILPGPSGDAAFVWLARRHLKVPLAVGAGAALLSRLLDLASLLVVGLVMAPLAGVRLPRILLIGGLLLAAAVAGALAALFAARSRQRLTAWLEQLPLPPGLHERLHGAIDELGSGSRPLLLVTATLAARITTGLQYFALFAAIDQPLTLVQVWFALSIRTLLIAVPVQGLGGLGTMQVWWTAGLSLLGWPADLALTAGLAVHLLDLCVSLPQAAIGGLILVRRRALPEREEPATTAVASRLD